MIDFNKVTFTNTKRTDDSILSADINWHREVTIRDEEFLTIASLDGIKAVKNHAKNMLLNKLWDDVYGDINEPIHRIYAVALRGCPLDADVQEIRRLMGELAVMLQRPPRLTL